MSSAATFPIVPPHSRSHSTLNAHTPAAFRTSTPASASPSPTVEMPHARISRDDAFCRGGHSSCIHTGSTTATVPVTSATAATAAVDFWTSIPHDHTGCGGAHSSSYEVSDKLNTATQQGQAQSGDRDGHNHNSHKLLPIRRRLYRGAIPEHPRVQEEKEKGKDQRDKVEEVRHKEGVSSLPTDFDAAD